MNKMGWSEGMPGYVFFTSGNSSNYGDDDEESGSYSRQSSSSAAEEDNWEGDISYGESSNAVRHNGSMLVSGNGYDPVIHSGCDSTCERLESHSECDSE